MVDILKSRNMTMVELLKWLSHGSVYVNVIRKSNNSANNLSHGIPTKYRLGACPCQMRLISMIGIGIWVFLFLRNDIHMKFFLKPNIKTFYIS